MVVVSLTDHQWRGLAEAIGREDFAQDRRFATFAGRIKNVGASSNMLEVIKSWMKERESEEVLEIMRKHDVPCGRVQDDVTLMEDPQLKARGMLAKFYSPRFGEVAVSGVPIKLSESPGEIPSPCPDLGQHTEEILKSILGIGDEEIEKLREEKVIWPGLSILLRTSMKTLKFQNPS